MTKAADRVRELEELLAERNREIEDLRQANRILAETNHVKDDFLALLSHELRTPLTGILLWADILGGDQAEAPDESLAEGLAVITRSAERLLETVEGLLDLSRFETGRLRLNSMPADPVALVGRVIESYRPRAEEAGLVLASELEASAPTVHVDGARIQQVVRQLLANAVKFTDPPGTVRVRVAPAQDGAAIIEVSDTGRGISDEHMPHVFERFRHPPRERLPGAGLGIGLALSRALVDAHGGTIDLKSGPEGTTVTVRLPAAGAPRPNGGP